jgi:hypothetical protein
MHVTGVGSLPAMGDYAAPHKLIEAVPEVQTNAYAVEAGYYLGTRPLRR